MANVGTAASGKVLQGTGSGSGPTFASLGVNSGLQNHGTVIAQGNAAFVAINPGTTGQVLTSNGNSVDPSFQDPTSGAFSWEDETSNTTITYNRGYTVSSASASLITLTLPSTAPYGSIIRVVGNGVGGWQLAQNAGQTIHFGSINTTTGLSGYIQSTQSYDSIELLCTIADTDFTIINGPQGNIIYN